MRKKGQEPKGDSSPHKEGMITLSHKFLPVRVNNSKGISRVRLITFVFCLAIVALVGLSVLRAGKRAAYEITAKHDLRLFVDAQEAYYAENEEYLGEAGDIIRHNPNKTSDFSLEGFSPSEGVTITIISDDPFIAVSKHNKAPAVFEFNFEEGIIRQR